MVHTMEIAMGCKRVCITVSTTNISRHGSTRSADLRQRQTIYIRLLANGDQRNGNTHQTLYITPSTNGRTNRKNEPNNSTIPTSILRLLPNQLGAIFTNCTVRVQ